MERTYINEAQKAIGGTVKVQGFIENLRNSKYMAFIVLKDITGKLQITVEKEDHPDLVDTIDQLTPDSVITVTGKVVENDYVKMGGVEMIPESIEIESIANALPIVRKEIAATKKKKAVERSSIDQRIDYRWIDLRTDENQLMFKAQSCFVNAMRKFLLDRNFIEIHTPKLIAAASESGSEVFKVDYFDRNAYLAQSPQFYKQMAMAAGFERIFETGPVFRAEKSYTNKHSTEFSGFDLEFSYITSYKDVMKMEEELLTAGLQAVKDNYGDQIKEMFGQEVIVPTTPFPVVKLADLYKGLEEEFGYTVDESEKGDLTTEAERLSYEWVKKHYGHEFLFITDYSAEKRAFYHMRDENGVPQGYDLIWRGVEITTGAQREHRYEVLKKQAEEKGLADDVKFYLEFFQYGCPPHGGFGLGIDRLTMLLCGLTIKDAEFLFRGPNRLTRNCKNVCKGSCAAGMGAFCHIRPFPNIRLQQADRNPVRCTAQTGRGEQLANQEQKSICREIGARTGGDIYIGVVGPVRSGKSTFIKRFMEQLVLPTIGPAAARERARDELPSRQRRTIMTTEPKFIPEAAVPLQLEGGGECRVRLIDCVGYMVEGAMGHEENDKPRMVKSPWFDHEVPLTEAAEIGGPGR